ncbi:MAG: PLD nuclease N-terminal domain-containing protein [Burkholderiales bacterium]|nr:PLD nuclease N-terminal domain-containing protein [Pseudomonadota bacterium]
MEIIGGLFGIIIFVLDVIAIFGVLKSGKTLGKKILWIIGIIVFPVVGLIVYYFFGRENTSVTA